MPIYQDRLGLVTLTIRRATTMKFGWPTVLLGSTKARYYDSGETVLDFSITTSLILAVCGAVSRKVERHTDSMWVGTVCS